MEKHWHQNVSVFPPNSSVDTDSLSVMVHSDEELVSDYEGLDTALKPPVRANEPPVRANELPTTVSEPQSGATKPPDEAVKRPNGPTVSANTGDLYNPDSQHPSWEPQADLTAFLEIHFRRKLSYDQVSDILDSYSISSVDCLFSPTLDNSVLNQISPLKSRKYTQERDKELASVQRSMLNITGPLCCFMFRPRCLQRWHKINSWAVTMFDMLCKFPVFRLTEEENPRGYLIKTKLTWLTSLSLILSDCLSGTTSQV